MYYVLFMIGDVKETGRMGEMGEMEKWRNGEIENWRNGELTL
jgi:hypothetical protein